MRVYLNGEYVEREHAAISAEDRGFLFGDGVYEVVRAVGGRLIEARRHWRRLARSLDGVMIQRPAELDDDALSAIAHRLLDANDLSERDALLYVQVTRGAAVRTHHFPAATACCLARTFGRRFTVLRSQRAQRMSGTVITAAPRARRASGG